MRLQMRRLGREGGSCEMRFRIIGTNAGVPCETRLCILAADVGVGATYETPFRILGAKQAPHDFESLADSDFWGPSPHNATNARVRVD